MKHEQPSNRRSTLILLGTLVLGLAAFSAIAAPGWLGGETVKGNGAIQKQAREVGHFTGVSLGLPAQVELRIGSVERVEIEADENLLPLVETVVENGSLEIRAVRKNLSLEPRTLKIIVHAKQVDNVSVGGSGTIGAEALRAPRLKLDIGGSGTINIQRAEGESVATAVSGSGKINIGGTVRKLDVSIAGSGDVRAAQLKADDVAVSIAGSGDATVWAANSLKVSVAGSGDVNYYGDPKVQTSVAGSGGAKRLGAAPR